MKKLIFFVICFLFPSLIFAQTGSGACQGTSEEVCITHKADIAISRTGRGDFQRTNYRLVQSTSRVM